MVRKLKKKRLRRHSKKRLANQILGLGRDRASYEEGKRESQGPEKPGSGITATCMVVHGRLQNKRQGGWPRLGATGNSVEVQQLTSPQEPPRVTQG